MDRGIEQISKPPYYYIFGLKGKVSPFCVSESLEKTGFCPCMSYMTKIIQLRRPRDYIKKKGRFV